jgi:hypothetical protein
MRRCTNALSLGWHTGVGTLPAETHGLHTRCSLDADDGHDEHIGMGLAEFEYQRWFWYTGDRRTYDSERDDERAWEL